MSQEPDCQQFNSQQPDPRKDHDEALARVDAVLRGSEPLDLETGMRLLRDYELLTVLEKEIRRKRVAARRGVRVSTLDEIVKQDEKEKKIEEAAASDIGSLAIAQGLDLFNDLGLSFVTMPVGDHKETCEIDSAQFETWIVKALTNNPSAQDWKALIGAMPSPTEIKKHIHQFDMLARISPEQKVHVRTARRADVYYVDLCDPLWRAVEISATGWRVVEHSVKFQRQDTMRALPYPAQDGDIAELRRFLHVDSVDSEQLVLTWLTFALLPEHPHPLLALSGIEGSGKSSIATVLRGLVDPSSAPLMAPPTNRYDLFIAARNLGLLALDNLSSIPEWLSDALCMIATGGAFRTRRFHTNLREVSIYVQRPIFIGGISVLPERADLLDRSLLIRSPSFQRGQRRGESDFGADFEASRATIFGGLLDVICAGLRRLPDVKLADMPRLGDFALWGCAVEEVLGYAPGSFMRSYEQNIQEAFDACVESSPIVSILLDYLDSRASKAGEINTRMSSLDWLNELNKFQSDTADTARQHPRWPRERTKFNGELKRAERLLQKFGVTIKRGDRESHKRYIIIKRERRERPQLVKPTGRDKTG